jgi:hypothetical protein
LMFRAAKIKDNMIAVQTAWKIGDVAHSSERMFGPVGSEKDVFGEVRDWTGKICKQAGVADTAWRRT